jgi:hypothetical protein
VPVFGKARAGSGEKATPRGGLEIVSRRRPSQTGLMFLEKRVSGLSALYFPDSSRRIVSDGDLIYFSDN